MTSLAQLRAKLLEQNNKEQQSTNDNAIYAFWNIPFDSTVMLRFLPDADPLNDFFWVERNMIKLPFAGVVGSTIDKEVTVQVPCMEMWGETCPVLTEIRPWFKDTSLEDLARKYWKKRSYIFQGFIRTDPMGESDGPENPIRRFVINPSIFRIIHDALMDPEMEEMPTDYVAGTDFKITRTRQGEYSSYVTSGYSRKTTAITEEEKAAIDQYKLFNLSDFLPKKPDAAVVKIIAEMFEASYNGESYDPERWASHYKPYGLNVESKSSTTSVATETVTATETPTVKVTDVIETVASEPVVEPAAVEIPAVDTGEKKTPQAILAQIKARRQQTTG